MKFLSNWAINMTDITIIISIWAMNYDQSTDHELDYKPLAIWLMSANQALNVGVAIVFFILPSTWNGKKTNVLTWLYRVAQHTAPLVLSSINLYFLSDVAILYTDIWVTYTILFSYTLTTYILTKRSGNPAYPFLTYNFLVNFVLYFWGLFHR